ncbi:MAG: RNA polymerase sigma factor [Candidatus Doudnabacteria bacterium]|nr:RNA polymerase sigma factor [Candidatus Doudnabacteria bacterium]
MIREQGSGYMEGEAQKGEEEVSERKFSEGKIKLPVDSNKNPETFDVDVEESLKILDEKIKGYCMSLTLGDKKLFSLAEDAHQNALMRAWKFRESFHGDSAFSTWVFKIAKHEYLTLIRKTKTKFRGFDHDKIDTAGFDNDFSFDVADAKRSFADVLQDRQLIERLLSVLPNKRRKIITRHYLEGVSVKDIAKEENTEEQNIKNEIIRGRRKMLKVYDKMNDKYSLINLAKRKEQI